MSWLIFAFAGPIFFSLSNHFDKYLIERFFRDGQVAVLMFFTALAGSLLLPFIAFFRPETIHVSISDAVFVTFSGLLYIIGLLCYLQALKNDEASTVTPLFQMQPVVAAVLGFMILGEVLSRFEVIGGLLIVIGSIAISLDWRGSGMKIKGRLLIWMISAVLALVASSVLFKLFALQDSFWVTTFWYYIGGDVAAVCLFLYPPYRSKFLGLLKAEPRKLLTLSGANEALNLIGALSARYATLLAPLGLVQAIGGTQPLFVFVFGLLLGREILTRNNLFQKATAILLIIGGVVLLNV